MRWNIKDRFREMYWKIVASSPIAHIPWSAIRRIGQSRLLALTIIVPFLGSLLLFNQHVVSVLTLSPELVGRWLGKVDVEAHARTLTLQRLYFVYFGLWFLGLASAIFAVTCPLEIKSHGSAREYLEVEGEHVTKSRMGLIIPTVARVYRYWWGEDEEDDKTSLIRRLGEPSDFMSLGNEVLVDLYLAVQSKFNDDPNYAVDESVTASEIVSEAPVGGEEPAEVHPGEDDFYDEGHDYLDHRGRPDSTRIANVLSGAVRHQQHFVLGVQELASKDFRRDILTLFYMAQDHSKPRLRVFIAALYALGFGLLLWPSGLTFVQLATSVVHP